MSNDCVVFHLLSVDNILTKVISLIGTTGAGAGGVGNQAYTNQAGKPGSTTGILEGREGNNHSNLGSGGVPTSTATEQHHKDHHLGRDAAGAGVVGGAAYEAEKHHHNKSTHDPSHSSTTGTSTYPSTGIHDSSRTTGTSAYPASGTTSATHDNSTKDHHYGRDAAGAGVVGTGAYEAEKHHKHDKDLTAVEKEAKKEHKHEEKLEKKHEKEEKKSSSGGFLSFLHRDKNKKYTKEEEEDFERQEREHHSHAGRNTAAVGGAGAVGAGAYEAEKVKLLNINARLLIKLKLNFSSITVTTRTRTNPSQVPQTQAQPETLLPFPIARPTTHLSLSTPGPTPRNGKEEMALQLSMLLRDRHWETTFMASTATEASPILNLELGTEIDSTKIPQQAIQQAMVV